MFIPMIELGLEFTFLFICTKSWMLPDDSFIVFYRIKGLLSIYLSIFFLPFLALMRMSFCYFFSSISLVYLSGLRLDGNI